MAEETKKTKFETWLATAKTGDEYANTADEKAEINKAVAGNKVARGVRKTTFVVKLK